MSGFEITDTFIDDDVATKGVWQEFFKGSELLIASAENPSYRAALAKGGRSNKVKLDGDPTSDTVTLTKKVTAQAMAQYLLLDWKGLTKGGEPLPYSRTEAFELLMKSPQLFDSVQEKANDESLFRGTTIEDAKKPSTGTSDGDQSANS